MGSSPSSNRHPSQRGKQSTCEILAIALFLFAPSVFGCIDSGPPPETQEFLAAAASPRTHSKTTAEEILRAGTLPSDVIAVEYQQKRGGVEFYDSDAYCEGYPTLTLTRSDVDKVLANISKATSDPPSSIDPDNCPRVGSIFFNLEDGQRGRLTIYATGYDFYLVSVGGVGPYPGRWARLVSKGRLPVADWNSRASVKNPPELLFSAMSDEDTYSHCIDKFGNDYQRGVQYVNDSAELHRHLGEVKRVLPASGDNFRWRSDGTTKRAYLTFWVNGSEADALVRVRNFRKSVDGRMLILQSKQGDHDTRCIRLETVRKRK